MDEKIHLGDHVRDRITGYAGIVVARTEWLNGCVRLEVQPTDLFEGKRVDSSAFDEAQLVVVESRAYFKHDQAAGGGDRPNAGARPIAKR